MTADSNHEEYISFSEITEQTGLTYRMIAYRVGVDRIPVFIDPGDRRKRVIRKEDMHRLTERRPAASHLAAA